MDFEYALTGRFKCRTSLLVSLLGPSVLLRVGKKYILKGIKCQCDCILIKQNVGLLCNDYCQ